MPQSEEEPASNLLAKQDRSRVKTYQDAWSKLSRFAKAHQLPMVTLAEVDTAAAWPLDSMYFDGEGLAAGMTLLASVKHHRCAM